MRVPQTARLDRKKAADPFGTEAPPTAERNHVAVFTHLEAGVQCGSHFAVPRHRQSIFDT